LIETPTGTISWFSYAKFCSTPHVMHIMIYLLLTYDQDTVVPFS